MHWCAMARSGRSPTGSIGTPPEVGFLGGDLIIVSGEAAGKRIGIRQIKGDSVILGFPDLATMARIKPGDKVRIDNSNFLAAQTYHRHQVPGSEFKVWDQFRKSDGTPIYPQRPTLLGPMFTANASGSVPDGSFDGRMILVESLWDREALPWSADWYRTLIRQRLGAKTDGSFRLWYSDRSLHGFDLKQEDETRTVSYLPMLQQALRDVAAWVEKGTPPPATTNYRFDDGQIVLPASARARRGIQPVVTLLANGAARAEVAVGQEVQFTGEIAAPPGTGEVIAAEWDFEGRGIYPATDQRSAITPARGRWIVKSSFRYSKPGTYFAVLRGYSQRQDAAGTPFARIRNLARARVVVK